MKTVSLGIAAIAKAVFAFTGKRIGVEGSYFLDTQGFLIVELISLVAPLLAFTLFLC